MICEESGTFRDLLAVSWLNGGMTVPATEGVVGRGAGVPAGGADTGTVPAGLDVACALECDADVVPDGATEGA